MKKIKKLKLINWHFFDNQEINFSDINVITGENGTGKSTILDAIHYLQSGGTCEFNSAAKTLHSGRTVENYLKARVGGEKQEFIRDSKDIIGHIVIEYENTTTKKPFVLGCVLQLTDGRLSQPIFYKIDGETFSDQLFFTPNNEVKNFDELEKTARAMGLPFQIIGLKRNSERARKHEVLQALGVSNKYETLFAKAIGFGDLGDISRFATDFLLPEAKLDLSSIKDSMDAYRDIQAQVTMETTRAAELKPIVENKERYEEWKNKEAAYRILMERAQISISEAAIKKNESSILVAESHYKDQMRNANEYKIQRDSEEKAAKDIRESREFAQMKRLSDEQKRLTADRASLLGVIDNWETRIKNETEVARRAGTSLDLSGILKRRDYDAYLKTLSEYRARLETLSKENISNLAQVQAEIGALKNEREPLAAEAKELEANSYAYPSYVIELENKITEAVRQKFPSANNLGLQCFSTFLEIDDPEWRDAVEGLLDKRRFDLFVNQTYFDIAARVFASNPKLKDFFGVGVIKLEDDAYKAKSGSLAEKISALRLNSDGKTSELKEPRQYINFLLGDVMCVESISDFKVGQKAITKQGAFFDGKAIRFVSADAMKKPFIGQEAINKRLEDARKRLNEIKEEMSRLDSEKIRLSRISEELRHSKVDDLLEVENHWKKLSDNESELQKTSDAIKELGAINGDLVKLNQAATQHEEEAKRLKKRADECESEARKASESKGSLNSDNANRRQEIQRRQELINSLCDSFPSKDLDLEHLLEELAAGKTGQALYDYANQHHATSSNQKQNAEREIVEAMNLYCGNHPGEMISGIENYMEFVRRYNKIINDNLAKLQPDLTEAYQRSVSELREHFISRIRKSLNEAKGTIDALNRTLRRHPFGIEEETFEFVTRKSTDGLLGGIYHIAMETNQDTVTDNLFIASMDEEGQALMDKVFEILTKPEDDPETAELRQEITDYRSYMNYDIRIKVRDGNNRLYSENFGSKSGGETQTPFYALIAGAFQSISADNEKNGRSPTGLVLFDEAFNNMDGGRIKQMLEFYKELNIQLVISVPSSRISYISPFASQIISLAKEDYRIAVIETRKETNAI